MSYLSPLRLHFAGQFQAAVSTVNNDVQHFDNSRFVKPTDQELQTDSDPNGWWNPRGDADFRLIGCAVTAAFDQQGKPLPDDPVMRMRVADSDRQAPAKLVDLDPEQQLVSTIFGLDVRICDTQGANLVRGSFEPIGFMDIWTRAVGGGGDDINACSMYQSVITGLEWAEDLSSSPFLQALQKASGDGLLSIKFMVDGYNMSFGHPDFTLGRIVGTIGPASADEPRHMVRGRQFMAQSSPGGFFTPAGGINFCQAVVDETAGSVLLDLGNALHTVGTGGAVLPTAQFGTLQLAQLGDAPAIVADVGDYGGDGWYERTAGIVALPVTPEQIAAIKETPLALVRTAPGQPNAAIAIQEAPSGLYARADQFVFRLDPGAAAEVTLYATRFGEPYGNAKLNAVLDPGGLQMQSNPSGGDPPVATPVPPPPAQPEHAAAIDFPATATTDATTGAVTVTVPSRDPQNPRKYIDGQLYGVRVDLDDAPANEVQNPWAFISFLVFDDFKPADDPPTWHGTFQPIFEQYANLYPVMYTILDLGSYEDVCGMRDMLLLAFGLDVADPNSMPVTRDLSSAKREAILAWLRDVGPDGNPLKGEPPAEDTQLAELQRDVAVPPAVSVAAEVALRGGKAAAVMKRIRPVTEPGPPAGVA